MGYMGSGKTKLGKMVSKKLKIPFFDLDEIISKKENLSINEIFRFKGDKYFEILKKTLHQILNSENEIVLSLLEVEHHVISITSIKLFQLQKIILSKCIFLGFSKKTFLVKKILDH